MATFAPPTDLVYPAWSRTQHPLLQRLTRYGNGGPRGRIVILYDDDSQVIEGAYPPASYDVNGAITILAEDRVTAVFRGGESYEVTATQAATLTTAGYTVS